MYDFYECRPSFNRVFRSEADNSFQEWHRKEKCLNYYVFSRIPLCLLHLSTCLTGWVYDQESTNQLITEPYGNFRSILAEQG